MAKVTFSLDDTTVETLRKTAHRLRKPQSLVVREAIAHYAAREDTLSNEERERMLKVIDRFMKMPPSRPQAEVDRELREIRRSRRTGWRPGAT
jgi:predicted DNA-binding protein